MTGSNPWFTIVSNRYVKGATAKAATIQADFETIALAFDSVEAVTAALQTALDADTDAYQVFNVTTGSADAYVIAPDPAILLRTDGMVLRLEASFTNTGAATLNDGLSTKNWKDADGSALTAGQITSGYRYWLAWDADNDEWRMLTTIVGSAVSYTDTAETRTAAIIMGDQSFSRAYFKDNAETVYSLGTYSSGALAVNHENGHYQTLTLGANIGGGDLSFTNWPATGYVGEITLEITQDGTGSRTISWPAAVKWNAGTAPTLSTGAADIDIITLITRDGGTTIHGFVNTQNSS